MNGIEQAIEKMVQDATADLRERVEALEALAKAVRGAAWSLGGAEVEAVAEVRREPIRKGSNGHGNGPHHWSAALRQAAARRMKKKNSDPAFRRAIAKGNARRRNEGRAMNDAMTQLTPFPNNYFKCTHMGEFIGNDATSVTSVISRSHHG